MHEILELLKGSDAPEEDIATFMRAHVIFWLLGATDGHAKNFSIFLTPGGRYRMTPLYDVLTAQPGLDAKQVPRKKFKLAMAVGRNRHYAIDEIAPRHFVQSAELAGVGTPLMKSLFDDVAANTLPRTQAVVDALPGTFPDDMVDAVANSIAQRTRLIENHAVGKGRGR